MLHLSRRRLTGGGVVTNLILHGLTGWGTRLMPTEFVYATFWGIGDIYKDDELIAGRREVHVTLTEGLRTPWSGTPRSTRTYISFT